MSSSPPKVLVVEDDGEFAQVVCEFLAGEGFETKIATTGEEAVTLSREIPFDIVLLDLELPGKKGWELIPDFLRIDVPPSIVIMTAYGSVDQAVSTMREGAFDFLEKPLRLEDLKLTLLKGYENKRLREENIRLREALALHELTQRLNEAKDPEKMGEILKETLHPLFNPDLFWFAIREENRWKVISSISSRELPFSPESWISGMDLVEMMRRFLRGESFHFRDRIPPYLNLSHTPEPPFSFLVSPCATRTRVLGMIGLFRKNPYPFTSGDRKTLEIIGNRVGVALENLELYTHLEKSFLSSIRSLVNALEAKDEYTRGHSERVAFWSLLIADLLGLSPKDKEQIHRGALLHDIGKIGLRIDLLARAGKLTSEEWEEVKIHPVVGKKILEPIEFLSPVMPIILYHHERWDGKGYPFGLSGTEIPLFARIVAIADAFEVMITDRPYRPALSLSEAKQELRRCAGKQFDPDIVSSFLNYLEPYRETQDLPQPSLGENPVFFILKDEKKGEVR